MLNTTFISISILTVLGSPLFAGKSSINLYNSFFSKSSTHVSYNTNKLNIAKCTFSNFRKSVILVEAPNWNFTGKQIGRLENQPGDIDMMTIHDAVFESCISQERGAAISHYVTSWNGSCEIQRTAFLTCQTEDQGGAVFFVGNNFTMNACIGFNCSALFGQFIYVFLYELEHQPNIISFTSTLACSMSPEQGKDSGMKIWYGKPKLYEVNTTKNYVKWESASFYLQSSPNASASVSFCTISSCKGSSIIHARYHDPLHIYTVAFYNNTLIDNEVGHIDLENEVNIKNGYFFHNSDSDRLFFSHPNSNIQLADCEFDIKKIHWKNIMIDNCEFEKKKIKPPCIQHINTMMVDGTSICHKD